MSCRICKYSPLTYRLLSDFKWDFPTIKQQAGYTIKWIKNLPSYTQHHPQMALIIFISANILFFNCIYVSANALDRRVNSSSQPLNPTERKFNLILIDSLTGGSVLAFNLLLSKITHYPLSLVKSIVLMGTVIAIRNFFSSSLKKKEEEFKTTPSSFFPLSEQDLPKNGQTLLPEELEITDLWEE